MPCIGFRERGGIPRNLNHALGARNVAQRLGDKRGVTIGVLHARIQKRRHLLRVSQMLGNIVTSRRFTHCAILSYPNPQPTGQ